MILQCCCVGIKAARRRGSHEKRWAFRVEIIILCLLPVKSTRNDILSGFPFFFMRLRRLEWETWLLTSRVSIASQLSALYSMDPLKASACRAELLAAASVAQEVKGEFAELADQRRGSAANSVNPGSRPLTGTRQTIMGASRKPLGFRSCSLAKRKSVVVGKRRAI
jgi:hypothetical protein